MRERVRRRRDARRGNAIVAVGPRDLGERVRPEIPSDVVTGTHRLEGVLTEEDLALLRERRARHAMSTLWTAVWEASQFRTVDQIREHVEATLAEIHRDEP